MSSSRFHAFVAVLVACLGGSTPGVAQGPARLAAGPMVGYAEMREVLLWAQTSGPAEIQFVYWDSLAPSRRYTTTTVTTDPSRAHTAKAIADSVEPGRSYGYELRIDGVAIARPYPTRFSTPALWQWRTDPPAVRIALGSCFFVNEPAYDRPGTPYGDGFEILAAITAQRPDLMVWLGDNTYLREVDWYSRTGIFRRYSHTRAYAGLQPVLAAMSHYAIWDDHDYGPNDSDASFRDRHIARDAFESFWGNPAMGVDGGPGITTTFEWSDVQFFMMDDRTYKTANERVTGTAAYLGDRQVDWLISALKASPATFKVVAIGGQVLNSAAVFENYAKVPEERARLLEALRAERIPGVLFLSGDKHWTELSRMEREGTYPLYDLTVSPLTAGPSDRWKSEQNAYRVDGTLVTERNFGMLDITGPREDRVLTITIRDAGGNVKWTRAIPASELR
jgi:alkaline phosphatase D